MPRPQDSTTTGSTTPPIITPDTTQQGPYGRSRSAPSSPGSSPGQAGSSTSEVIGKAKETISNVASQAGDQVVSQLDTQKSRAAEGIGGVAQALRQTSDQLRQQEQGAAVHQYVSSAANQLERLSGYLRSTDLREMVGNVERFAREQPALFLGSAFVLGLLGARFLKSSAQSSDTGMREGRAGFIAVEDYRTSAPAGERYGSEEMRGTTGYSSPDAPSI